MTDSLTAPRLYHVHPLAIGPLSGWRPVLDHAAGLGFDSVLSGPVFDAGPCGNLLLTHDPDRLDPRLGEGWAADAIERLAADAASRGLDLLLDLVVDRAAAGGVLAGDARLDLSRAAMDPRIPPTERGATPVPGDCVLDLWAGRLADLAGRGVAGFRCLGIDRVPPAVWRGLIEAVRARKPAARFLAWTPGLGFDHRLAVAACGFDAVFSSLAWWDGRSDWLIEEHDVQRRIAPAIAFPEAPYGERLAAGAGAERPERILGRKLWLAASLGDGLLVPMGFEFGAREPFDASRAGDFHRLRAEARVDLTAAIVEANRFLAEEGAPFARTDLRSLAGPAAPVNALLRPDASDLRRAGRARLVIVNPNDALSGVLDADGILPGTGGAFTRFTDIAGTMVIGPGTVVAMPPAEVRVLQATAAHVVAAADEAPSIDKAVRAPRLALEALSPCVDHGAHPVKRIVGERMTVSVDIIADGHDKLAAALLWRTADEEAWREVRMEPLGNDRWAADLPLERVGRHHYTVEAWKDVFATFRDELAKKHAAGLRVSLELEEGRRLLAETREQLEPDGARGARLADVIGRIERADEPEKLTILLSDAVATLMAEADIKRFRYRMDPPLCVEAERTAAGFASWYEVFPRSLSGDPNRHGTFDDVIAHLPRVRDMGFDVLYFPPIHPIGRTNRKGRNNALKAGPDDPGSPYAIGSEAGGHDAIHPELGTLDDFRRLIAAAADHGIEIALDFAVQCSPDHPWLKEHPEWFEWRPDGSIRYAENPPKKYEDIVNVDFYADGAIPSLWLTLRDITLFWAEQGVRLFRVDNPHTKSFPFWEWMIADIRVRHPDVAFLAEAFTRPKVMYRLAKIGFSQSYTYFTWRNAKWELESYLRELNETEAREFFRPHFFVNTPDINPAFLQNAPRSAYLIRAGLAATLSGLFGVYNGFELCEGRPVPGKEEYLDSEKYELKAWDWDRPGNIAAEITRLNRIRRDNPALHSHLGVGFLPAFNDKILFYRKATAARENALLIAVCLDPHAVQEADVELPLWEWGVSDAARMTVRDLVRGGRFTLTGKHQRLRLDPSDMPYLIWRVERVEET